MNTNIAIYLILCLSALSTILTIYALIKIKLLVYLVDQPEVKKIGSNTKLNLKKIDRSTSESKRPAKPRPNRAKPAGSTDKKDTRAGKGAPKNDRFKDRNKPNRAQRGNPRGDKPRGTVVGNQSAQEPVKPADAKPVENSTASVAAKPEKASPRKEETSNQTSNQTSNNSAPKSAEPKTDNSGRRPLPARSEKSSVKSASVETAAQTKPAAPSAPPASEPDIQHGRRTRIKKSPTFEEKA